MPKARLKKFEKVVILAVFIRQIRIVGFYFGKPKIKEGRLKIYIWSPLWLQIKFPKNMLLWGPPYLHIKETFFLLEGKKKSLPLCRTHLWCSGPKRAVVTEQTNKKRARLSHLSTPSHYSATSKERTQVGRKVAWHKIQRHCGTGISVGGKKGPAAACTIRGSSFHWFRNSFCFLRNFSL